MRTVQYVETEVSDLQFGYWDAGAEEFVPIDPTKTVDIKAAAEVFDCSEALVEALAGFAESIREAVRSDLVGIWNRFD